MTWDLSEGELALTVSPETGGELVSVRHRGAELLYRGGGGGWRGGAPWLFPAVGRTRGAAMPIHGLMWTRPWTEDRDGEERVCRAWSDAQTRALYPFDFVLTARYGLDGRSVVAELEVEASRCNAGPMPFSLGNHLSLAFPDADAVLVRSPARSVLELEGEGFLSGAARPAGLERGRTLGEDPRLGDQVLGGFGSECWVEAEHRGRRVRVTHGTMPDADERLFVLWSDATRRFLCVEPWCGGPDSLNTGRGLIRLEPGRSFLWTWTLSIA